jgi:hypothetical protein
LIDSAANLPGPVKPRMIERLHKFDGDKQAFFASSKFAGPSFFLPLFYYAPASI